jgi:hypothetical protein
MLRSAPLQRSLIAAALMLGLGVPALAQDLAGHDKGPGSSLTDAQRQKLFPGLRSLSLQDHRARIAILQKGEGCIAAATTPDAQRDCMRQERDAMQAQRKQNGTAMRELFQRNGIPVPEWKGRRGGRHGGPDGTGAGWDQPGQPGGPQLPR